METGIHKNVHHSGKCCKEKLMIKALLLSAGLQWKASMIAVKKLLLNGKKVRMMVDQTFQSASGNFETGWLATCPSKLLDVCKSKDEIERMQFWELFTDKFEYENWDMDKCPAVKEVTSRWNDLKKSFEEDSSEDESDEGIPTCEDLKSQLLSVRTEGCLQYSCSTGSMKVEMLEKCKELINAEVQKIVKKRLEECKG